MRLLSAIAMSVKKAAAAAVAAVKGKTSVCHMTNRVNLLAPNFYRNH
jgi:hypothetical protein